MPHAFDLVIFSATPCGIAAALTAARGGLRTLLVNRTPHVGGFLTSGCGGWEAPYDGPRSAMLGEFLDAISDHYAQSCGEGSPQHRASRPDPATRCRLGRPRVEPRVARLVFERLLAAEPNLTLKTGCIPWQARVEEGIVTEVTFIAFTGGGAFRATAPTFIDASYEGDLAMVCGADYRLGRESRDEFNEPHAGKIFTRPLPHEGGRPGFPRDSVEGRLNIRHMGHSAGEILDHPESGRGDRLVMAYNFRPILTDDPANRVIPERPANYHRFDFRNAFIGGFVKNLPNRKVAWNGGRLIGPHHPYPEGSWPTRLRIEALYRDFMLSLFWHLRNEAELPPEQKALWQSLGLARDEFEDNGHFPHEIYVRESIRIRGLKTFTEHDGVPAPGLGRSPLHADSIAMTDWPLDSVAVTEETHEGSRDGVFLMAEQSRPAQVPYGTLVPANRGNLLVPLCLSATHVGWGCIRLEPVWVQCGEAAAHAAILAARTGQALADLEPARLQARLLKSGATLAFLNDVEALPGGDRAILQWAALEGFFPSYDARPHAPLSLEEARLWLQPASPAERAARLHASASGPGTVGPAALRSLFPEADSQRPLTRLEACTVLFRRHSPFSLK